ncbi:unnamed protein product [Schistosoma curassoni]|uniref:Uncharacterized protein n=1 Tax=Schistosoma curassoni TaxID=6186 RepID=A0A183JXJ0_9TREM|nr:unnamed protein product [Schistosoma curassoni]
MIMNRVSVVKNLGESTSSMISSELLIISVLLLL